MKQRMTSRAIANQMHIPEAIEHYRQSNGYAPTVRELAEMVGRSVGWTHAALACLQRDNIVSWKPRTPRTLRVVKR